MINDIEYTLAKNLVEDFSGVKSQIRRAMHEIEWRLHQNKLTDAKRDYYIFQINQILAECGLSELKISFSFDRHGKEIHVSTFGSDVNKLAFLGLISL